jgi:hypothetical protein
VAEEVRGQWWWRGRRRRHELGTGQGRELAALLEAEDPFLQIALELTTSLCMGEFQHYTWGEFPPYTCIGVL